ncbi:MAG: hypothetical protein ABSD71_03685 [Bacteroidales bacterium]|jgi:hypothetical protein
MDEFEKILDLNNEFEAENMEEALKERNIPFGMVPVSDSAFGSIEVLENGWGYLEAPSRYKNEILEIYKNITNE